jgi:tRNA-dihydrouridine synthase A
VDSELYGSTEPIISREQVVQGLLPYIEAQLKLPNQRVHNVTRHILGLFHGEQGAKLWRRHLSENATKVVMDETLLLQALKFTQQ